MGRIAIFVAIAILMSKTALASDRVCRLPVSKSGLVTCFTCQYADQFAQTGAAVALALGRTSVRVTNNSGNVTTFVSLSPTGSGNSVIFGASIPFTLALNYMLADRDHISVASLPLWGRPSGAPFVKQDASLAALEAQCKVIEEEVKKEWERRYREYRERKDPSHGVRFSGGAGLHWIERPTIGVPRFKPCHSINGGGGTRCYYN